MNNYRRFIAMIITSTVVMFGLMYLNTYSVSHLFLSETRIYMALYMGSAMAIIMLLFMLKMYSQKTKNTLIVVSALSIFSVSLFLVRSQATIEDTSWMQAMIPHHSIAVLTSENANIKDARVKKLAEDIIKAQRREIEEMKWLINDIKSNGEVTTATEASKRPVPKFNGEL